MATLLDKINKRKTRTAASRGPSNVEQTLRTKATGKAQTSAGARGPNLGADRARTQGREASRQLGQQGALEMAGVAQKSAAIAQKEKLDKQAIRAEQGLAVGSEVSRKQLTEKDIALNEELTLSRAEADTYRRIGEMNNQASLALNDLASQRQTTIDNIFSTFDRENLKMTDRREMLQLELAADALALQDKKYLHELEMIGKERFLEKDLQFKQESLRVVLGQGYSDFIEEIGFTEAYNKNARDFEIDLQNMSDSDVMMLARKQIDAESRIATMQAWASAFSGATEVAGMAASQGLFDKTPPATPTGSGGGSSSPVPYANKEPF